MYENVYNNYMNKIVIYHGSPRVVEKPIFNYVSKTNDYGYGFYCTQDLESAKEWANKSIKSGFVNSYLIDLSSLNVLDLTDPKYSPLHWITILLLHRSISEETLSKYEIGINYLKRHYFIDLSSYDVVIGYRADDAYFKFPLLFMDNALTLEKLEEIYKLGHLGKQIFIQSEKAFSKLKYLESKQVSPEYFDKYNERIKSANKRFEQIQREERYSRGTRLRDLVLGEN